MRPTGFDGTLLFDVKLDKGLPFNTQSMKLEVVTVGVSGVSADKILVLDERNLVLASKHTRAELEGALDRIQARFGKNYDLTFCWHLLRGWDDRLDDSSKLLVRIAFQEIFKTFQ